MGSAFVSFGSFEDQAQPGYTVIQIPFFLLIGVIGGLLGAIFNYLNMYITLFRRRFFRGIGWRVFMEVLFVTLVTALVSYVCTSHLYNCVYV